MSDVDQNADPGARLNSPEEAAAWMHEQVAGVREARAQCDSPLHADVKQLQRAYHRFLVKHGAALGTCMCLFRCGLLSNAGYHAFRKEILDTMASTTTTIELPQRRK